MQKILNRYTYSQNDLLGKGAFGTVYKGTDTKTKQLVAIKLMNMDTLDDNLNVENFKQEMNIMKQFNHPNIVKMFDYVIDGKQNIVIFDFCEGGDLSKFLDKNGSMVDEATATQILLQIVNGFREVVAKGYIHRDVKPANILLKNGVFKIGDFGLATKTTTYEMFDSQVGTPLYMAPQLLDNVPYSSKCDIWSLGIMAYEMIYGRQPWACRDMKSYLHNIRCYPLRFPIEKTISEQFKDFVRQCLKLDEKQRIDWNKLFDHPLLDTRQFLQKTYKIIELDDETKLILRNVQCIVQLRQLNLNDQFKKFDADKCGELTKEEFYSFIANIDPSLTTMEMEKLFKVMDKSNDNKINIDEFKELFCNNDFSELRNQAKRIISDLKDIIINNKLDLQEIFKFYDMDKCGELQLDEFTQLIKKVAPALNQRDISIVFAEFDINHDNKVNFQEFKNALAIEQDFDKDKANVLVDISQKFKNQIIVKIKAQNQSTEVIFKKFNVSRNNKLSIDEFATFCKEFISNITIPEIKLFYKQVDRRGKQFISFDDFNSYFKLI